MIRPPTCLVKMYDNMPPWSTTSRRISFFLLNDRSEEAAKSTTNWQVRNISETCKVPMTRSNRNNTDFPNFHFAVFSSFEFFFGVTWGNRSSKNFRFSCMLLQKSFVRFGGKPTQCPKVWVVKSGCRRTQITWKTKTFKVFTSNKTVLIPKIVALKACILGDL